MDVITFHVLCVMRLNGSLPRLP